jgi:tRNA-modifying protein YgfZ
MGSVEELEQLRGGEAVVDRSDRGFVLVTGPDALSFLQALVSADLDAVADGDGTHSLLLTPQGKLDVDFRLVRVGDDAWLDCDPGLGGQLAASLNRFRIRVQADVLDRSADFGMLSYFRSGDGDAGPGVQRVPTRWGHDLIGPRSLLPTPERPVGPVAYEAWRIEQGIPRQPFDLDDATIPQEAFLEQDAVSFTKGCFLGQELVCRIDSRGHVNRFLRRFGDIEGDWPGRGADVVVDGKVVGALTSVAPAEVPTGGLGYVRREVDPPALVELRWDGGSARAVMVALDG